MAGAWYGISMIQKLIVIFATSAHSK